MSNMIKMLVLRDSNVSRLFHISKLSFWMDILNKIWYFMGKEDLIELTIWNSFFEMVQVEMDWNLFKISMKIKGIMLKN